MSGLVVDDVVASDSSPQKNPRSVFSQDLRVSSGVWRSW